MGYIMRLSKLLVDKGTEALRITLDGIHHPVNLPAVLNFNRTSLLKLRFLVINDIQWNKLFPLSGIPPDSKTFDVTLLTVLLRNICGLVRPKYFWDNMPPDKDRSLEANITRIKLFRNQVAHACPTEIDEAKFENLWQKISDSLVDLKIPKQEIDDLKIGPLTDEEEIYVQNLQKYALKEEESKSILNDINVKLERIDQFKPQLAHDDLMQNEVKRPRYVSEKNKFNERQTDNGEEQLLQKFAKHNFKSKIRCKVQLFHPGTRNWLLKKVESWFTAEDESRLLLITAGPGFGKSVFAAKLCDLFEEKEKLAACHFCEFLNSNLGDPMRMLESLASQMCDNVPGYKEKLLDQLRRHHQVRNPNEALQIYFQNPLDDLEEETRLIVIDGLNERKNDDKSKMVNLIACDFPVLPKCVKILVTSRPELYLQELNHVKIIRIEEHNNENESDLLQYLKYYLPSLAARVEIDPPKQDHHPSNVLSTIVEKCEGSFQYASHTQDELRRREDLDTMTSEEISSFAPKGMGSVYKKYFYRLETELEAVMNEKPDLLKLLELLVATETPIPLTFIARVLNLDPDCHEMKNIISKVNEAVSCLLYVWDDLVTFSHNSIYDWLLGNGYCNHEYTVKISDSYSRLYQLCVQITEEIESNLSLGYELRVTNEVEYVMEFINDYEYLMTRNTKIDKSMQPQSSQSGLRQRDDVETIKSPEKAVNFSRKRRATEQRWEETNQDENISCFKEIFLDSEHKLKEEIHEKLRSFHWLCGAYGLIGPNKKKPRPHVYLTVKRGTTKADATRDLEENFNFDTTKYFELHQEQRRKPNLKHLGQGEKKPKSNVESGASMYVSSFRPAPGGRVVARTNVNSGPNPMRLTEENETCDFSDVQVTGALTMFCFKNGHHYALTCFHVGCVNDESHFNAAFHKVNDIQNISSSLPTYVDHAREKEYYFTEASIGNTNNEPIALEDDECSYAHLGHFHSFHYDNECDILSLKLSDDVEIDCTIADVTSPEWDSIFDELYEMVFQNNGKNPVIVEKIGHSSGLTQGRIVSCNFTYWHDNEPIFQNAIVIKGCSGPFVEDGESGSLVFFLDKNDQKQAFAYCVCEVDEATISFHDDSDNSTWSSDEDQADSEHEIEDENEPEPEDAVEFEDEIEEESESEVKDKVGNGNESEDEWEDNDEMECGESDTEVVFQYATLTGPYIICLRLDTALKNLGFEKAGCFNDCGSK